MGKHWTPQYLLRGFSEDHEHVWQYDKDGRASPKRMRIEKANQSKDAYPEDVEAFMARLEGVVQPAIDAFRTMSRPVGMTPRAKKLLACYVSMFLTRSPGARNDLVEMFRKDAQNNLAQLRQQKPDAWESLDVDGGRDQVVARMAKMPRREVYKLQGAMGYQPNLTRYILANSDFAVVEWPDGGLLIPDSTITWDATPFLSGRQETHLPLSDKRLLIVYRGLNSYRVEFVAMRKRDLRNVNRRSLNHASRFIFAYNGSRNMADERKEKRSLYNHSYRIPRELLQDDPSTIDRHTALLNRVVESIDDNQLCYMSNARHKWQEVEGSPTREKFCTLCRFRVQTINGVESLMDSLELVYRPWWHGESMAIEGDVLKLVPRGT